MYGINSQRDNIIEQEQKVELKEHNMLDSIWQRAYIRLRVSSICDGIMLC